MTKEQQWNFDHRQSDAPLQWTLADRGLKEATIFKDAQLSSTISDGFTLQQTQQKLAYRMKVGEVFMFYQFTTLTHRIIVVFIYYYFL